IAAGDLSVEVKTLSEHDALGNAFVAMVANLRQKAETAQRIATGDLSVEVALQSDRDELGRAFATMVENLREINRQVSDAIGVLVASVNDLSEQSNLLAVNAAIEAAKAGEHGVGFAVVALEVKSLAQQSRQATAQVRSILGDIQKATSNAVVAAEQGARAV